MTAGLVVAPAWAVGALTANELVIIAGEVVTDTVGVVVPIAMVVVMTAGNVVAPACAVEAGTAIVVAIAAGVTVASDAPVAVTAGMTTVVVIAPGDTLAAPPEGVYGPAIFDHGPCPAELTAATRNSYWTPFVRPVTVAPVTAEVPSANSIQPSAPLSVVTAGITIDRVITAGVIVDPA